MAKSIMLQGTASSVGKSMLAAALCRIFVQEGYRVAPFKSQNMALNSYVTKEGREMGRAQVVQAEAAKIEPRVEMNPILLKPTSHQRSQVIINGYVYKDMTAQSYQERKESFIQIIKDAYSVLDEAFEIIVLEGAGSPAEINLKKNDIVNMGMAEMVDAPVILVGDIDRGGIFASIYGTIMLMDEKERERIKGFIINKFRGDIEILKPGIKMLEDLVEKPCLGVVPYMDVCIDDEDSVTTRFQQNKERELKVAVIKTPYVSNFTDFTALEMEEDIGLFYVTRKEQLQDADLIILPGSKNTIKDMEYIFNSGLHEEIYRHHRKGTAIIGICGGYQMLGLEIEDPYHVESSTLRINGLGLLETRTTLLREKRTRQTEAQIMASIPLINGKIDQKIKGYEIHMGETEIIGNSLAAFQLADGQRDGAVSKEGTVLGTYLHGIFDNDELRRGLINYLRTKKGLHQRGDHLSYEEAKEREYDRLAQGVRESLDMSKIMEIVGVYHG